MLINYKNEMPVYAKILKDGKVHIAIKDKRFKPVQYAFNCCWFYYKKEEDIILVEEPKKEDLCKNCLKIYGKDFVEKFMRIKKEIEKTEKYLCIDFSNRRYDIHDSAKDLIETIQKTEKNEKLDLLVFKGSFKKFKIKEHVNFSLEEEGDV